MRHDHLREEELVSLHYLQHSDPHLRTCEQCQFRAAEIMAALRSSAAEADEKPESYWDRQRRSVWRRIDAERSVAWTFRQRAGIAAAAAFVTVLVAGVMERETAREEQQIVAKRELATATAPLSDGITADPWDADALEPYRAAVEWESWLEEPETGETLQ